MSSSFFPSSLVPSFPPPFSPFCPFLSPSLVDFFFSWYRANLPLHLSSSTFLFFTQCSVQLPDIQLKGMIAKFVNFMGLTSRSPAHHHLNRADASPGIHRYLLHPLDPRERNLDNQTNRLVNDVSPCLMLLSRIYILSEVKANIQGKYS